MKKTISNIVYKWVNSSNHHFFLLAFVSTILKETWTFSYEHLFKNFAFIQVQVFGIICFLC